MNKKETLQAVNEYLTSTGMSSTIRRFTHLDNGKIKLSTLRRAWERCNLGTIVKQYDPEMYKRLIDELPNQK